MKETLMRGCVDASQVSLRDDFFIMVQKIGYFNFNAFRSSFKEAIVSS